MAAINILLWAVYFIALYFSVFLLSLYFFEPDVPRRRYATWPAVAILIPAWNEESSIRDTIESTLRLAYPPEKLSDFAIDHGSDDRTGAIMDSYMPRFTALHLPRKKTDNKAVALNAALAHVTADFVACLDADSTVSPSALKSMLAYFTSPRVAIVTPMMLVKQPRNLLQKLQKYEYITSLLIKRFSSYLNCIYVAPGPFSIYRTKTLKALRGFDETALAEDMEIVYRMQRHRYVIRQCLVDGFSYAAAPSTVRELYKQRRRWYGGSLINLFKYRDMTLNARYGDFGFYQMPRNFFAIGAAFLSVFLFAYYLLWPLLKKVSDASLINFDVAPYFRTFTFSLTLFDLQNTYMTFVLSILLFISALFFVSGCRAVGEKLKRDSIFPLLMFFSVYPLLLGLMYLSVIAGRLVGRPQAWQKMHRGP